MAFGGPIPWSVVAMTAAATVVVVMLSLGVTIAPGELRSVLREPWIIVRALVSIVILVPLLTLVATRVSALPWAEEIGIVLMAIAPGAPIALRRSLAAGGHRSFAPALQIVVACLAVVSMPVWIAALNSLYAGHASIAPLTLAREVFIVQLLPLGAGMTLRHVMPRMADGASRPLARLAAVLLLVVVVLLLVSVWPIMVATSGRALVVVVTVTALALAFGHALGGPARDTRTAVAFTSAARNPGLALLVAAANQAPPQVAGMVLVYALFSAVVITPYELWRRRTAV